ncbi:MAG: 5'-deoxyadenosine deaminase [Pyrinomonadaceae bacterium]
MTSILIKSGTIVTMDAANSIVRGNVFIRDGKIERVGAATDAANVVLDATGCVVLPGFVQTHIHLCQTLFRGSADDLSLIDWLKKRIWPLEAAHSKTSIRAAARLGLAELVQGGTTCVLTMETVNHTAEVFKVVEEVGFRATVGKCMMDKGDDVPKALRETTDGSIRESVELLETWQGAANGLIRYCFAPRFAISCSEGLLKRVATIARERGVMVHTHASENVTECALVEQETGLRNVAYLEKVGLTGSHVALAHCVHLSDSELEILSHSRTNVAHCPSSNLKLGSGIAPITRMLEQGISVSLGADGAACNNRLDIFTEMRTAALLQKGLHGPEAVTANRVLRMATIDGARAMGLGLEVGSIEPGKRADLAVISLGKTHSTPRRDLVPTLVYSSQPSDVRTVIIDGNVVMRDRELLTMDEKVVLAEAEQESSKLNARAKLV